MFLVQFHDDRFLLLRAQDDPCSMWSIVFIVWFLHNSFFNILKAGNCDTLQHTSQNFGFVYFSEGNFLIFQIPVVELEKVYSSDSLITTILDPILANFIWHKEEVGF